MAKINIPFNNTNYSIDESTLSTAYADLKSHLSTVMNGTGTTINLDGIAYSIDSAKLASATNDFVSHLGTISGSGSKVVVNGVEYSIDATKMASAISELHTVLGGMQSDDSGDDTLPEKNEYGFYYNVPYGMSYEEDGEVYIWAYVFYEDGDAAYFCSDMYDFAKDEVFIQGGSSPFPYDEVDIVVSDDGKSITLKFSDEEVYNLSAIGTEHGVYYEYEYASDNNETIIFYPDNSAVFTASNVAKTLTDINWVSDFYGDSKGHYTVHDEDGYDNDYEIHVTMDGKTIYMFSYDDNGVFDDMYYLKLVENTDE